MTELQCVEVLEEMVLRRTPLGVLQLALEKIEAVPDGMLVVAKAKAKEMSVRLVALVEVAISSRQDFQTLVVEAVAALELQAVAELSLLDIPSNDIMHLSFYSN
jgi:hypothetical protein